MYKAFQNKRYYLSFNNFRQAAKRVSNVYHTGFHKWGSDDMKNYSLVLHRFRIIFGIKKELRATCSGA